MAPKITGTERTVFAYGKAVLCSNIHQRSLMTKIRQSARGEDCTINLPGVCNYNPETSVWAHSNRYEHGKGMGLKAKDEHGAYACYDCHMVYDRQKKRPEHLSLDNVEEAFTMAMLKSRQILKNKGLI
jgi:hypothetical protein